MVTENENNSNELGEVLKGLESENEDIGALVRGGGPDKQGVLHRLISAAVENKDYRQQLLMAAFDDTKEARLCAGAIAERLRYGVSIDVIVDMVIAQCAVKSARVEGALRGITHQYFMTNYKGSGNMPDSKKKSNSPM